MLSIFREAILLVIFFLISLGFGQQLTKLASHPTQVTKELQREWDPQIVRLFSFGFLPVSIDWLWLESVMDVSQLPTPNGTHSSLYYTIDLLTSLDPSFYFAYVAGAHLLTVYRSDPLGAKELLLKARGFRDSELTRYSQHFQDDYWADAWNISVLLAYVDLFELNDLPSAGEHFRDAARFASAPAYVHQMSNRLSKPGGIYEVGDRLLEFMIRKEKASRMDPKVMVRLKEQREALKVKRYLFSMSQALQEFLKRKGSVSLTQDVWSSFLMEKKLSEFDPWGGTLRFSSDAKVLTTTPHQNVMNLE